MKTASPLRSKDRRGLTLLELTVVIVVLISMTTVLIVGAHAWRRGSNRTACIMTLRNVQISVRSYQNMYGFAPGTMPIAERGTQSIADHLLMKGYIEQPVYERIVGRNTCPGGGKYTIAKEDAFPAAGDLFMSCTLKKKLDHQLPDNREW